MTFDYIIVGAGSAGCILANRLSESPNNSVLLLEAGGSDRNIMIAMPTALSYPMNTSRYNWQYWSEPEPYLDNRRIHTARGKGLGGSSSINGMAFVRGHACDFDAWHTAGAAGWDYQSCLPYFKRLESWYGDADQYRGVDGEVSVNRGNDMRLNPLYQAFIDAGVESGYGFTADYNGERQEGFGQMQMNVDRGTRASTSRAYLRSIKHRKNLTIIKNAHVEKILFSGSNATGVSYWRGSKRFKVSANREVVLSAGSIGSPQILQLSGIGPSSVLANAGVTTLVDRKGVGRNLQDHLEVFFQYKCEQPVSLNRKLNLVSKAMIGAQWLLFKTGLGRTNHFEACAFIRSDKGVEWPDIQYHFLPAAMSYDGNVAFKGDGYQVHVGPNRAHSRGSVEITTSDFRSHPKIEFNYLEDQRDVEDWRKVIRLTREILTQPALDKFRGDEIQPSLEVQTDDEIDAWVRANAETAYHASCSCKMGSSEDDMAVVDPECKVIGVGNLRVVDSSIFPSIPNGNLNAPSMMVAEKAADLILGKQPLRLDQPAPVWIAKDWKASQREQPA